MADKVGAKAYAYKHDKTDGTNDEPTQSLAGDNDRWSVIIRLLDRHCVLIKF